MNHDEYRAINAVNWSTLREATKSAAHYRYALDHPREETDAMRLGRAIHTAVFEPDMFAMQYVVWDGGARRGNAWELFCECARQNRRTILLPDQYEQTLEIQAAVQAHPRARVLLEQPGHAEHTITWTDADTGLPCKARLDWLSDNALVDLKSTRSVDARQFGRHAGDMLYHCQLAFYATGLHAGGVDVPAYIIAVEQTPPHDVAVFEVTDDQLYAGEVKVQSALNLVAACRKSGEWPGRYPDTCELMLPAWEWPSPEEIESTITD